MSRLLPLSVLCLCLATSTAAAEGFYVSESFGGTRVKGELSQYMEGALHLRISAGYRAKDWAIEGVLTGHLGFADEWSSPANPTCDPGYCYAARTVTPPERPSNDPGSELVTYGLEHKRIARVSKALELYTGGGLGRGSMSTGYAGIGLGVRAGAQLKGKVPAAGFLFWPLFFTNWGPKVTAAVFVDSSYDFYWLRERNGSRTIDAQLHHLSLGFAVGSDF